MIDLLRAAWLAICVVDQPGHWLVDSQNSTGEARLHSQKQMRLLPRPKLQLPSRAYLTAQEGLPVLGGMKRWHARGASKSLKGATLRDTKYDKNATYI